MSEVGAYTVIVKSRTKTMTGDELPVSQSKLTHQLRLGMKRCSSWRQRLSSTRTIYTDLELELPARVLPLSSFIRSLISRECAAMMSTSERNETLPGILKLVTSSFFYLLSVLNRNQGLPLIRRLIVHLSYK